MKKWWMGVRIEVGEFFKVKFIKWWHKLLNDIANAFAAYSG